MNKSMHTAMNNTNDIRCACTNCQGSSCTCGCQKAAATCACGPQCQCGASCSCGMNTSTCKA